MKRARIPVLEDLRPREADVVVLGAGAAGLLAALSARGALAADGSVRAVPRGAPRVVLLTNEPRLGLKILVSGGGRCNVTNAQVSEVDYVSDAPRQVKGLLRGFPTAAVQQLFSSQGCPLYSETLGKLFPRSDKAQDVLNTLLDAIAAAEIPLVAPAEVAGLTPPAEGGRWAVQLGCGKVWSAGRVILATGGKSLPKTGSRGVGFRLLRELGHTIVEPVPALTPILFAPGGPVGDLAGLTVPAVLSLVPSATPAEQLSGRKFRPLSRAGGSLLITHQGASGPAALDVSGVSARSLGGEAVLRGDFWSLRQPEGPWGPYLDLAKPPGASLPAADCPRPPSQEAWTAAAAPLFSRRDAGVANSLAARLPKSLVQALLQAHEVEPSLPIKQLNTRHWRQVYLALTQADLGVSGVAGYQKAEVTGGGARLAEFAKSSLESKLAPGLFVCGEVLNVTGRLGGFNFQWAWSSGYAAGRGARAT